MIHKIKSLYDEGRGYSIHKIARSLRISRNTVRKYARLSVGQIQEKQTNTDRQKKLDSIRPYLIQLLQTYPEITAVKARRKIEEKGITLAGSNRSLRRYMRYLKKTSIVRQPRYYAPVTDMVPGNQCQVDLGEVRNVPVGEESVTLFFAVFVLSYSRLMYVAVGNKPVDTQGFIQMHDEAFRYFGGVPDHCVYDQTKLVAIEEKYREVLFNDGFYQYATASPFSIHVCEGYDPESKGKVEAGVKYVKQDFFYAETFESMEAVRLEVQHWLDKVANVRIHGTTHEVPREVYESRERSVMRAYAQPAHLQISQPEVETRRVDKTSLISYKGIKYSVPMIYQSGSVGIRSEIGKLYVHDLSSNELIAQHTISDEKGVIIKNNNHYRDHSKTVADREAELVRLIGDELAQALFEPLRITSPKIYKDQLAGLIQVLKPYLSRPNLHLALDQISKRGRLTATFIRDYLDAFYSTKASAPICKSARLRKAPSAPSLARYAAVSCAYQEVNCCE